MSFSKLYQPEMEQAGDDCQRIVSKINNKEFSLATLEQTLTILATNIKDIAECILNEMDKE